MSDRARKTVPLGDPLRPHVALSHDAALSDGGINSGERYVIPGGDTVYTKGQGLMR